MNRMINGGFLPPALGPHGIVPCESAPIFSRGAGKPITLDPEMQEKMNAIERGEFNGDMSQFMANFALHMQNMYARAVTSSTSALPVRENLEAEAKVLVPLETPMRNRIPRVPGSGSAVAWRQITSVGGGYNISTTVTTGASSATQTVGSTAGMYVGMSLYFATTNAYRIVSSITNATTVVLTATISTTTSEVVTAGPYIQGPDAAGIRAFFSESGAPADHVTAYASKSASYKLMGTYFSVTGFAAAVGASFQDQLAMEKTNAIRTLMLNEENAIINGSSSLTAVPWGDGSTNYAFDGLINLITTANGTPAPQVQTSVGALTTTHIDAQLTRLWAQGGSGMWMLMNGQEVNSLAHLAEASGSIIRINADSAGNVVMGKKVGTYTHPITGEPVEIIASRFLAAGTILFGCDRLPDGNPSLAMSVLPQVQLPSLAPTDMIQGYVAQELAPTTSAPQVYPGIVTVYEVLQMRAATVFAKSSGVTAV